jgi:2-polyprenyl-3-methyl-5-hydroxy-6-metoxy-1,4-benzoquinol methylase
MSYSQRLLQQGSHLTRLAHHSRFDSVLGAIAGVQYNLALDYGCGDGWLLKTAYEQNLIKAGLGVEIDPQMISAFEQTCINLPQLQVCQPQELAQKISPQSCDLILCTETLEHVGEPEKILDDMLHYSKSGATMVISVPIEIGPSLLLKQLGRYFANRNGNYGYERYRFQELFSAAILWDVKSFPSSHTMDISLKSHKGFDYRNIDKLLQEKVVIEKKFASPFPWMGNLMNSTMIWICRAQ